MGRAPADHRRDGGESLVGRDSLAAELDGVRDHVSLVAEQCEAAPQEHQRWLAVLPEVAGESPPERDERVLSNAVRRSEQAALAARWHDLLREDPLGQEEPAVAELEDLTGATAVVRDVV